jgi:hypothetical protein
MFRAVTIEAYSRPMTPAPTTMRSRGSASPFRNWVDDPLPVERDCRAVRRPGAAGDQDSVAAHPRRPLDRFDLEGVGVEETRGAGERRDVVSVQLGADDLDFAPEDLLRAEGEVRDRDLLRHDVVTAVEELLRFARDAGRRSSGLRSRVRGGRHSSLDLTVRRVKPTGS